MLPAEVEVNCSCSPQLPWFYVKNIKAKPGCYFCFHLIFYTNLPTGKHCLWHMYFFAKVAEIRIFIKVKKKKALEIYSLIIHHKFK